jgi:hypothetical protein
VLTIIAFVIERPFLKLKDRWGKRPKSKKIGSEQEFDERPIWRGFESLRFPVTAGGRYCPALISD